jgi:hypothetical protein
MRYIALARRSIKQASFHAMNLILQRALAAAILICREKQPARGENRQTSAPTVFPCQGPSETMHSASPASLTTLLKRLQWQNNADLLERLAQMDTINLQPRISDDGRGVVFIVIFNGTSVECVISRAALESGFWLTPNADEARMIKTFRDGSRRIRAIVERRLLARPASRIELTAADF